MSLISGEKARAAITRKRRTAQRAKDAIARAGASAATEKKPGGRPMAARAAKRAKAK
jgi:hypothetical protein